jgi:hypothetical protein
MKKDLDWSDVEADAQRMNDELGLDDEQVPYNDREEVRIMNNNDERDYAEELENSRLILEAQDEAEESYSTNIAYTEERTDSPTDVTPPECEEVCVHFGYPHRKPTFYFTFGVGHRLIAHLPEHGDNCDGNQDGISLGGKYVKIQAVDETAARLEMIRRWGHNWSSVYYDEVRFKYMIQKYKYTELKLL